MSSRSTAALTERPSTLNLGRLRSFVGSLAAVLDESADESLLVERGSRLLAELVRHDDWLPDEYAAPSAERYQQYLLHCDSRERFSVVSFVWGPGQATPIHDHRVWGLIGMLRGAELSESFTRSTTGTLVRGNELERLEPGDVSVVSPRVGDIHRVQNAYADRTSISIHVYGANIGAVSRATYDSVGTPRSFISGYANTTLPNLWSLSS